MRLLSERSDYAGGLFAQAKSQAKRGRHRCGHGWQHLPLWYLPTDSEGHQRRCGGTIMSTIVNVSRRNFLRGVAGAGGFMLGLRLAPLATRSPFTDLVSPAASANATLTPNLFVSIDTNGLVTIMAHRVEMGQGVRTSVPMI